MKTEDLIMKNEQLRNDLISKIVVFLKNATVDFVHFASISFGYDYDLILYVKKPYKNTIINIEIKKNKIQIQRISKE